MRGAVLFALTALPGLALAEGRVSVLDCTMLSECDVSGVCTAALGGVSFRLTPQDVGADGAGRYLLDHAGQAHTTNDPTGLGPYQWTEADGTWVVLAYAGIDGRVPTMVWTRLSRQGDGAETRFLSCKVLI